MVSLNSQGSDNAENKTGGRNKLLKYNNTVVISSLNTKSLSQKSKRYKLAHKTKESHIDIFGIQEHRIIYEEPFRYAEQHGRVFITTKLRQMYKESQTEEQEPS